jgi:hypothetical protein
MKRKMPPRWFAQTETALGASAADGAGGRGLRRKAGRGGGNLGQKVIPCPLGEDKPWHKSTEGGLVRAQKNMGEDLAENIMDFYQKF